MRSLRAGALSVLVIALVVGLGWASGPLATAPTPSLTAALASVPSGTTVVGFTDWRRIRDSGVPVDELSERDVSTRSELARSRAAMQELMGWSVDDLAWEAFAQGGGPGVLVAALDGLSPDAVEVGLGDAGFVPSTGGWTAGPGVLTRTGLSTVLEHVVVLERERLVVAAETPAATAAVVEVVRGGAPALSADREAVAVAQALAGSDAVLLQRAGVGCDAARLTSEESLRQADVALESVGPLASHTTSGRAITDRGGDGMGAQTVRFAMAFDAAATAREQARIRESVSTGPFIGRTGQVEQVLRLVDSRTRGRVLTLEFERDPARDVVMTATGPLLFAAC
ncbi:hypothetical protein GCM10009821_10850 [Aeromicrobium halocynthiae]|uniref:Uncharacterized protein n=1 Tax=Aeromicrobium halocynthiae TaxID=560557 RepID=A0ABN2VVK6_9ACTN